MKYNMSPNVAVRTKRFAEVVEIYANVPGFPNRSDDTRLGYHDANPLNMYVLGDNEVSGLMMELFVYNSEAAKEDLISHGCEVIRWRGKGQDC